jgi:hypothetical protein
MQSKTHQWRFFRAGGFDQVRLDTAEDLLALGSLDQKLWLALSCPVRGIEFDTRTLELIDQDGDGHVRPPELIAAVAWAQSRLSDVQVLAQRLPGVPLAAIRDDDEDGQKIVQAARALQDAAGLQDGLITVEAAAQAQARFAERALQEWEAAAAAVAFMGEHTAAAYAALQAVRDKVDDWFVRCSLVAFDQRAGEALNAPLDTYATLAGNTLAHDAQDIAALPLAQVGAQAVLSLQEGLNPAWAQRMQALRAQVVAPLLGTQATLSAAEWQSLKDRFTAYGAWLAGQPDPDAPGDGVLELEKLARYVRDLLVFANNFVAFRDFYARQGPATFQIGTLYFDGRSCELCVAVNDPARHAAMASLSRICLVYVDCVRGGSKMSVAAAFTAGDADQLVVGRNGVFYDRQGRDWDATITRVVDHPISLRQAFWSPFKRLARLASEQVQKLAAAKAKTVDDRMAAATLEAARKGSTVPAKPAPGAPAPAAAPAFDVAKFAGIFAAIGLAVGALGTALASIVASLFALKWWQMPIALAGLLLLVSGPSVLMAWFKLHSRNLAPLLDANGWAINARARINIPFGTSLTQLAQLPADAERSLADPYAEKKQPWDVYAVLAAAAALAAAAWHLGWVRF